MQLWAPLYSSRLGLSIHTTFCLWNERLDGVFEEFEWYKRPVYGNVVIESLPKIETTVYGFKHVPEHNVWNSRDWVVSQTYDGNCDTRTSCPTCLPYITCDFSKDSIKNSFFWCDDINTKIWFQYKDLMKNLRWVIRWDVLCNMSSTKSQRKGSERVIPIPWPRRDWWQLCLNFLGSNL